MFQQILTFTTQGRKLHNITSEIDNYITAIGITNGFCNIFLQHTSASLILCENDDPQVQQDLETFLSNLVKDGDSRFLHNAEGPDDMSAHIRSVLTQNSLGVPIQQGHLALGTWQGIFLWEHRFAAFQRKVIITVIAYS